MLGSKRSIHPEPPPSHDAIESLEGGDRDAAAVAQAEEDADAAIRKARQKIQQLDNTNLDAQGDEDLDDMETFDLDADGGLHRISGPPSGARHVSDAQRIADEAALHVEQVGEHILLAQSWSRDSQPGDAVSAVEEERSPRKKKKKKKQKHGDEVVAIDGADEDEDESDDDEEELNETKAERKARKKAEKAKKKAAKKAAKEAKKAAKKAAKEAKKMAKEGDRADSDADDDDGGSPKRPKVKKKKGKKKKVCACREPLPLLQSREHHDRSHPCSRSRFLECVDI